LAPHVSIADPEGGDGVRRAAVVFAPLFAVAIGWCVAHVAGFNHLTLLGWLPGTAAMVVASFYLARAARLPALAPAGRRFWRSCAIACVLIAPATKPFTESGLGVPVSPVLMGGAVVLLSVGLLLVLWALLGLPAVRRASGDRIRHGLDAATVLLCAATFLWHGVLRPRVENGTGPYAVLGLLVTCLLCLLAVLAVIKIMLAGTNAVDPVALRVLSAVVLIGAIGSALVPVLQSPRLSGVSNVITTTEGFVAALAGVAQARNRGAVARTRKRRSYSVLPYVAVGALDALLTAVVLGDSDELAVLAGTVAATALVVVRQLLAFRDNTALLALLHQQATHDSLTGLANRVQFNTTLAEYPAGPLSVILVDLDDFKTVNDTLGHPVGDSLLIEVGRRLSAAVRPTDLVARLGGDEFAILLPDTPGLEASDVASRILAELDPPARVHDNTLTTHASVGVAERGPHDQPQDLLRHADVAMYAAKRRGKSRYAVYSADLDGLLTAQQTQVATLRGAIDAAELFLAWEPAVRLADGYPVERAAIARWRHPHHGVVPATDIICASSNPEAAALLATWTLAQLDPVLDRVSARVAGSALRDPGFAARVTHPDHLVLEVDATTLEDDASTRATLAHLRDRGVRVALDVGAALTLDLLMRLPFDRLVVDVAAFQRADGVRRRRAWASGVAQVIREAGLEILVTGLTRPEQADTLRAFDFTYARGPLFHAVVPADRLSSATTSA
jgi:diguanylate cyclase (GGDEF)-like protein